MPPSTVPKDFSSDRASASQHAISRPARANRFPLTNRYNPTRPSIDDHSRPKTNGARKSSGCASKSRWSRTVIGVGRARAFTPADDAVGDDPDQDMVQVRLAARTGLKRSHQCKTHNLQVDLLDTHGAPIRESFSVVSSQFSVDRRLFVRISSVAALGRADLPTVECAWRQ